MGKLPGIVVTCVVSVVCGFLGALGAVTVLQGQLQGPQGASGLQGPPGERGPAGLDGTNGADGKNGVDGDDGKNGVDGKDGATGAAGKRGLRGQPGEAATTAPDEPVNIGTQNCSGGSVEVVTDVTVRNQEIQLQKQPVCVTG